MNGLEQIELRTILNDISDEVFERVVDFVDRIRDEAFNDGYRSGNCDGQNGG